MKGKIALALASILVLTVMLTWPLYTKPVAANSDPRWLYYGMWSVQNSSTELAGSVTPGRASFGTPLQPSWNITFSDPWYYNATYGWIVNITVPRLTARVNSSYMYESLVGWVNETSTYLTDGYGWIFLNASKGDVDVYTSNNSTGSYWIAPSPKAGQLAAPPNQFPSPGADGVAGTADDGFGNGTKDPAGSSVLYLKTRATTYFASAGTNWKWTFLFAYDWVGVWTTAVAYDIVTQSGSGINGYRVKVMGEPWEFLAGKHGYPAVSDAHPKWNAFVKYAQAWSQIDISTSLGPLDLLLGEEDKYVRWDCIIADVSCDENVDITDIVICALAFGAKREGLGPDGKPGTSDDRYTSDSNWNPQGDTNTPYGEIDIGDIVRIAIDFGAKLTPDCIIRL